MTTIVSEIAEKWLPFPVEQFFTAQRAPDMWFGDELPPTFQELMNSPLVTQGKAMMAYQVSQHLAAGERRRMIEAQQARYASAAAKVGGRKRH
jgi:hypothetical protein